MVKFVHILGLLVRYSFVIIKKWNKIAIFCTDAIKGIC